MNTASEIVEAVRVLARICSDDVIASALTRNGLVTGRGNRWTRERVVSLRSYHDIPCCSDDRRAAEGWMNLSQAAAYLGVSAGTVRLSVERGEIKAEHPLADGPWIFNRLELQTDAAVQLVARIRRSQATPALATSGQTNLDFSTT